MNRRRAYIGGGRREFQNLAKGPLIPQSIIMNIKKLRVSIEATIEGNDFKKLIHKDLLQILTAQKEQVTKKFALSFTRPHEVSNLKLTPADTYTWRCFRPFGELFTALESLPLPLQLMSLTPRGRSIQSEGFRSQFLKYHISHFYFVLGGVLDRCLLLTNAVFGLNLANRHCKFDIISSCESLAATQTKKTLKNLFDAVQSNDIGKARNDLIHGRQYTDDDLRTIETIDRVKDDPALSFANQKFINQWYRHWISERRSELIPKAMALLEPTNQFLGSLKVPYEEKRRSFNFQRLGELTAIAKFKAPETRKGPSQGSGA